MKKLSLILVLTLFLGVGVAFAQTEASDDLPDPGILPDHPLYFVKSIGESFGGAFSFGQTAKIDRGIKLSEKRLAEARALADKGESDLASSTLERYQSELEDIQERVDRARSQGEDIDAGLESAIERVAEATLKHQSVLADVYERVPEQAKSAISRAMEASSAGHENALSNIPEQARQNFEQRISEAKQRVTDKLDELRNQGAPIPQIPVFEEGDFPEDAQAPNGTSSPDTGDNVEDTPGSEFAPDAGSDQDETDQDAGAGSAPTGTPGP